MKKRSPGLVLLAVIVTLSLYGWLVKSRVVKLMSAAVILLVPIDIWLRTAYIAKPGFLQPEVYGLAGFLISSAALASYRQQARENSDMAITQHGIVDVPVVAQPVVPAQAMMPAVQPAAPVSITGSSWQQGIATIAPIVQAPSNASPTPTPAPQPAAQMPQVIPPTVVQPTNIPAK